MIDDLPSEARNLPNFTVKLNESSRNDRTSPWRLNRPGRTNKISSTIVEAASELYVRWFKRSGPTNWLRDKCCSASERRRELKWRINHLPKMEFSEIQNFTSFCFQFQRTDINTKQGHGIVKIKHRRRHWINRLKISWNISEIREIRAISQKWSALLVGLGFESRLFHSSRIGLFVPGRKETEMENRKERESTARARERRTKGGGGGRDSSLKSLVRFIYRERKAGLAGIGSTVGFIEQRPVCLDRRVIDSDLADSDRRTRGGVHLTVRARRKQRRRKIGLVRRGATTTRVLLQFETIRQSKNREREKDGERTNERDEGGCLCVLWKPVEPIIRGRQRLSESSIFPCGCPNTLKTP